MNQIKLGFFSDTHTLHDEWKNKFSSDLLQQWEDLDILCFAGDCSSRGSYQEVKDFMSWFSKQPAKKKVMIAGNHDFFFVKDKVKILNFLYRNKGNMMYLVLFILCIILFSK